MSEFVGKVKAYRCLYNGDNYKIYLCHVTHGAVTLDERTKDNSITIAGDMPELQNNIEYSVKANPKTTKYGLTYYVKNITIDIDGAGRNEYYRSYLESITSKDQSDKILEAYPNFVNLILDGRESEIDLNKIHGIKDKKFATIREKVLENASVMDILEEYGDYELTFSMAMKILSSCNGSIDLVREKMDRNPYKLLTNISGIGFKRADELIMKIKPELRDSKYRLFSCADYLLAENESNGSTWMYFKDLYNTVGDYAPETIKNMVKVIENTNEFYFDKEQNRISRASTRFKEVYIADRIMDIINSDNDNYNWKSRINEEPDYESFRNIDGKFDLSDEQMLTLSMVFSSNFSVLTGSAGMGKSSGAKGLLNMMDKYRLQYMLTAPTGAASEVLSNYAQRPASTIHRVIFRNPDCDVDHMISTDLLVIDEASMINVDLMYSIMREIEDGTKVLLICDPEQIPAIGAGKIIHDIIESGVVPVNKLTKVYRFDDGGLAQVTTKVRLGQKYLPSAEIGKKTIAMGVDKDYALILSEKDKMKDDLLKVYFGLIKSGVDIKDIGIMSAMNVRDLGTKDINNTIQKIVSKNMPFVKYGDTEYRLGDKVVQTKNNYRAKHANGWKEVGIFNGNQGIITEVYPDEKRLVVKFNEEKEIEYFQDTMKDLSLAYATSVHKFQGSGCRVAIVLTPSSHTFMLNKNLLYTALTRSTERTIHFSDKVQTINTALKKSENFTRDTYLKELLQAKQI